MKYDNGDILTRTHLTEPTDQEQTLECGDVVQVDET